jgi:hypothetical protein
VLALNPASQHPLIFFYTGVDFRLKFLELQGKRLKLTIWDTAGQVWECKEGENTRDGFSTPGKESRAARGSSTYPTLHPSRSSHSFSLHSCRNASARSPPPTTGAPKP